MKTKFVFAVADSRLHADVMTIRLRRAGIDINQVSAIFSRRFPPNSFFCWLRGPAALRAKRAGELFLSSGPLRHLLNGKTPEAVPAIIMKLGVERAAAERMGEFLLRGHPILCVEAKDDIEAEAARAIFQRSRSDASDTPSYVRRGPPLAEVHGLPSRPIAA